jgi:hypothetical protein
MPGGVGAEGMRSRTSSGFCTFASDARHTVETESLLNGALSAMPELRLHVQVVNRS